jgi:arsenate reductase (glutaredoxin)
MIKIRIFSMIFYHYPRCSTCVKARKWLELKNISVEIINLVDDPPSVETLYKVHTLSKREVKALFNTSGQSYRQGNFKEKVSQFSLTTALEALAADGKLIKRPILLGDRVALIGFKPQEWAEMINDL